MIKASIIVAAYNVDLYLTRCIESLIAQNEDAIQIIIVDDGSTDNTSQMADDFSRRDARISVIHQRNQGLSSARNTGLLAAVGNYICFLDGDDWAEPHWVERMVFWAEATNANAVISGYKIDHHDSNENVKKTEERFLPLATLTRNKPLPESVFQTEFANLLGYAWNKMYKREWLINLGDVFEPNLSLIEDIEFNSRVLSKAEIIVIIPEMFVHYIKRPRLTLGTARDSSFLRLRFRAIYCMDYFLTSWNFPLEIRNRTRAFLSMNALWGALDAAALAHKPSQVLKEMVQASEVHDIFDWINTAKSPSFRLGWVRITMRNRWYRTALVPFVIRKALRKLGKDRSLFKVSR